MKHINAVAKPKPADLQETIGKLEADWVTRIRPFLFDAKNFFEDLPF